jgi:bifunctional non-homologous end joining protein LigD
MKNKDILKSYRDKRDFQRTPEPAGTGEASDGDPIFVVQEHDATSHHYDLRLQVDNVLKSWAVPKGPSTDPGEKRLAIATEDHPLDYAEFEGVIPKGEYGAGKVIVWDIGTYRNLTTKSGKALTAEEAIRHGHISVWLEGRKLRGGFALNRFKTGKQEQWLLVKIKDQEVDIEHRLARSRPESVLTGRMIEAVGTDLEETNNTPLRNAVKLAEKFTGTGRGKQSPMLSHIQPMLALLSKMPPHLEGYAFEYKWDGIRTLCYWDGKQMRLESRNNADMTHQWPELIKLGEALGPTSIILDGEIVALNSKNRVSFSQLSRRMHLRHAPGDALRRSVPIIFMIFDILYLNDRDLMDLTYQERRSILRELKLAADAWQTPEVVSEDPRAILEAAMENGMEGLVAKNQASKYRPGHRTRDWLKIKAVKKQEFVIGGWIPLKGSVKLGVGALLVGYYDDKKRLVFGGKVGTGFTDALRQDLKKRLDGLKRESSPFATNVPDESPIFVQPEIVAEIEFRELTDEGKLRHPSFKGLRTDKKATEVVLEIPR